MKRFIKGNTGWAIATLFALGGCSSGDFVSVTGQIMIDGEPAPGVEVEFEPTTIDRPGGIGYTDRQGYYDIAISRTYSGLMPGDYIIRVRGENEQERSEDAPPITQPRFPPKYHRQNKEVATVSSSGGVFDFNVITKSN